jgi:two-component system, chemotaxis family, protein-glutamate methylesterase/glutaminase
LSHMSTTRQWDGVRPFDAVVAVGSQGALDSFRVMVRALPEEFPAAIVFDLHRVADHGMTEHVLRRRCALPLRRASDGLELEPGRLFLAPHDQQLVIREDLTMGLLGSGEGVGHRFADTLLASAARALGPRLIAVVLSGRLDGGAQGVREVKRHGGRVIVQDPYGAVAAAMPNAALATGCVDFALPPKRLGDALVALCAAAGAAELFRVRMNAGVTS